jgi:UbiD family decarboxylase
VVFGRIRGHRAKVVAGLCGTRERIYRAIGAGPRDYYSKLIAAAANPVKPEVVSSGPVMEVTGGADLGELPVFRHYERDAGRYITSGIVVARSPDGKFQNASIHRLLVLGKDRLA